MNERPDPEYGSDDWASRRGYELAAHFDTTQSERMAQADDIADELKRLRDHCAAQAATPHWERVPDGTYVTKHGDGIISYGGDQLSISRRQKRMVIYVGTLPDGWELRRRVKKEQVNANP